MLGHEELSNREKSNIDNLHGGFGALHMTVTVAPRKCRFIMPFFSAFNASSKVVP